ncbi:Gfo/Idh/MocA family protein [Tsukamurella soli]|uniref:Gfo/Idh/MocA family oxidoreductase n=1 Tax=Tsukamurella soli TaxID=644556 RepID=A0ABP8JMM9_9ACTN
MTAPLRIGVLGASRIAADAIVAPAQELGYRLVAVAARDRDRAEAFADEFGVERVLDSYQDVLDDPDVEVVYNPLANSLHGEWNLAAVRAGKAVLSEKPFARNAVEAREVADAARTAGVPVLEGFHYPFHPITVRLWQLLGTLGPLHHVEIGMSMPTPPHDDPRWSYDLAGGALMDLGCYAIHVMRSVGRDFARGEPTVTDAAARVRDPQVDEACTVRFAFPTGATGTASVSMVGERFDFRVRVTGDEGAVEVHDFIGPHRDDRITVTAADGSQTVEHLGTRSTYTYQLEAYARALRTSAPLPIGLDDAVANMEMIDAAYRAAGLQLR